MNQPVERETDADATETNQSNVTVLFCGKLLACPEHEHRQRVSTENIRINTGFFAPAPVKPHSRMATLRKALRQLH
jgi:hypothetical protein